MKYTMQERKFERRNTMRPLELPQFLYQKSKSN